MKIAIQKTNTGFTSRWVEHCLKKEIDFKLVDIYDSSFRINDLDVNYFLWHVSHENHKDNLIAFSIIKTLELKGIKTFPSSNQLWHFDDKLAQSLFFQSQKIPYPTTTYFFDKREAIKFSEHTDYPVIAKLRRGSASSNVFLVENKYKAKSIIKKSFKSGFPLFNLRNRYADKIRKASGLYHKLIEVLKYCYRSFKQPYYSKMMPNEKGYILFQEFISNEGYDIRVVVVDDKAIALQRFNREADFRASGSGKINYPNENLDFNFIKMAFETADKLDVDSIGIDFIKSTDEKIYAIEMSFGFPSKDFLDFATGYWTRDGQFIASKIHAQEWILEKLVSQ